LPGKGSVFPRLLFQAIYEGWFQEKEKGGGEQLAIEAREADGTFYVPNETVERR